MGRFQTLPPSTARRRDIERSKARILLNLLEARFPSDAAYAAMALQARQLARHLEKLASIETMMNASIDPPDASEVRLCTYCRSATDRTDSPFCSDACAAEAHA